jgi:2-hydroxy-3-keto-5-methylthiopentenyl-1-phosphate phosphatase
VLTLGHRFADTRLGAATIVCDFDGTVALEDVTDGLLERFAHTEWRQIEAQWLAGRFGSRECMARQVRLIEATTQELDGYLDTIEIDPSFASFVEECEASRNVTLEVNSDGIDYAVVRILRNHGLSRLRVRANALIALSDSNYRLDFPHSARSCLARAGNCKCSAARSLSKVWPSNSATILIGDGASDFCVASRVNFVFAKARLLTHCRAKGIPHLAFDGFIDIRRDFPRVLRELGDATESARTPAEVSSDA